MSSAAAPLAAFKVTIGSGSAALLWRKRVGVHPKAHGATGFPPVESCLSENLIDAHLGTDFADAL